MHQLHGPTWLQSVYQNLSADEREDCTTKNNRKITLWTITTWAFICDHNSGEPYPLFIIICIVLAGNKYCTHWWKNCPHYVCACTATTKVCNDLHCLDMLLTDANNILLNSTSLHTGISSTNVAVMTHVYTAVINKQPMSCEAQLAAHPYMHFIEWPINPVN